MSKAVVLPGGFKGDAEILGSVEALVSELSIADIAIDTAVVERVVHVLEQLPGCTRVGLLRAVLESIPVFDSLIDALYDWCFRQEKDGPVVEDLDWELVHLFEHRQTNEQGVAEQQHDGKELRLNEKRLHVLRAIILAAPELSTAGERLFLRYFAGPEKFMRNTFLLKAVGSEYISDEAIMKALETYPLGMLPKVIKTAGDSRSLRLTLIDTLVRKYHSHGMGKLSNDLIALGSDRVVEEFCIADDSFSFPAWTWHSKLYKEHIQQELEGLGDDVLKKGDVLFSMASCFKARTRLRADFLYHLATSTDASGFMYCTDFTAVRELRKLSSTSRIQDPTKWSQLVPVLQPISEGSRLCGLSTTGWLRLLSRLDPPYKATQGEVPKQGGEMVMLKLLLHSKKLMKRKSIKDAIVSLLTKCCAAIGPKELVAAVQEQKPQGVDRASIAELDTFGLCRLIYVESMEVVKDHRFLSQLDSAWLDLHLKAESSLLVGTTVQSTKRDAFWKSWFNSCTFGLFAQAISLQKDITCRSSLLQSDLALVSTLISPLGALDLVMNKVHRGLNWALSQQDHDMCSAWLNGLSVVVAWSEKLREVLTAAGQVHIAKDVFELRNNRFVCPALSQDLHKVVESLLNSTNTISTTRVIQTYNDAIDLVWSLCEHTTLYAENEYAPVLERFRMYVDLVKRGLSVFSVRFPEGYRAAFTKGSILGRTEMTTNTHGKLEVAVLNPRDISGAIKALVGNLERFLSTKYKPPRSESSEWVLLLNDVWRQLLQCRGLQETGFQDLDHLELWIDLSVFKILGQLQSDNTELLRDLIESALAPTTPKELGDRMVDCCSKNVMAPMLRRTLEQYGTQPGCLVLQESLLAKVRAGARFGHSLPLSVAFIRNMLSEENINDLDERMRTYVILVEAAVHTSAAELAKTVCFLCNRLKNERGSGTRLVYQRLCSKQDLAGFHLSFTPEATLEDVKSICKSLLKLLENDMRRRDSSAVKYYSQLACEVQRRIIYEKIGKQTEDIALTASDVAKAEVWLQFSVQVMWQQAACDSGESALPSISWFSCCNLKPWMPRHTLREMLGVFLSEQRGLNRVIQSVLKARGAQREQWFERRLDRHTLNTLLCESLQTVRRLHYEAKECQEAASLDESDDWLLQPLWAKGILADDDAAACFLRLISLHGEGWLCVEDLQNFVRNACLDLDQLALGTDAQPLHRAFKLVESILAMHELWFLHFLVVAFVESVFKATLRYISRVEVLPIDTRLEFTTLLELWRIAHQHGPLRKWFYSTFFEDVPVNEQDVGVFVIGNLSVKALYKMTGLRVLLKGETVRALLEFSSSAVHLGFVQRYLAHVRQDKLMSFFIEDDSNKTRSRPFARFKTKENMEPTIPLSVFVSAGRILGGALQTRVGEELLEQVLSPASSNEARVAALNEYSRWPGTTYDQYIGLHKRLAKGNGDPRSATLLERLTLNAFTHSNCSLILAYLLSPAVLKDRSNQRTAVAVMNRMPSFLAPSLFVDIVRHLLSHNGGKAVGVSLRKAILRLLAECKDTPSAGKIFVEEWNKQKTVVAIQEECIAIAKKIALRSSSDDPAAECSLERSAWDILDSLPGIASQLSAKSLSTVFCGVKLSLDGKSTSKYGNGQLVAAQKVLNEYTGLSNEVAKAIESEVAEVYALSEPFAFNEFKKHRMTNAQRMRLVSVFTSLRESLVDCLGSFEHRCIYEMSLVSLVHLSRAQFGLSDTACLHLLKTEVNKRIEYVTRASTSPDLEPWFPRHFAAHPEPFYSFTTMFTAVIQQTFIEKHGDEAVYASWLEGNGLVLQLRDVFEKLLDLLLGTQIDSVSKLALRSTVSSYVATMRSATRRHFGPGWERNLLSSAFEEKLNIIRAAAIYLKRA